MIRLTRLRDLDIVSPNGRRGFVSAASGLVRAGSYFHVIGDDALHLASFGLNGEEPGKLLRLLDGRLPQAPARRKKQKPDFEALISLPARPEWPHGALLAFGSGSRPNRRRGALIELDVNGKAGPCRPVDLAPLLAPLDAIFGETNIEGAVVAGGELLLFQRGNGHAAANATASYPLDAAFQALTGVASGIPAAVIQPIDLGKASGVPLAFTDAVALGDGRIVFSAVAEDTPNPYDDGPLVGAVVGLMNRAGDVLARQPLSPTVKVEGIDARLNGRTIRLSLVTDADNPDVAASLYEAIFEP